jgi:hypothetical protein
MISLPEKIVAVHQALEAAELPYAFGGALALAWCTGRARGTIDIDINVFVGADGAEAVCEALPTAVMHTASDLKRLTRDGQARLWWDRTPIDLFLNTTAFHHEAAGRRRWETFMSQRLPFLSCNDLAVFKAFFNRTKDWADLEEMQAAGTLDISRVAQVIIEMLGADDERVAHLLALPNTIPGD